jgi:23S rRNA (adenine2503-C2)-methyltransferase
MKNKKINLLGFNSEYMKSLFIENGFSALDAKRVFPWIHVKLANSFDVMTDVPQKVRENLAHFFSVDRPCCKALQKSSDGTQKALLEFDDGNCVETVFIPEEKRNTICLSSQIGCAIGCKFCHTGTQTFVRNLTSSEIMAQVFFWKDMITAKNTSKDPASPITNIVFMGMGEPFLNKEHLCDSLDILLSEKAHNFSRQKITVSTSGIADETCIRELSKFGVKLAISLHAATDEKRSSLMPINKRYNIDAVMDIAKQYLTLSNTDHVTFEYLLLSNINESDEDALKLASLLRPIKDRSKVNLIVFNNWNGSGFKGSSHDKAHNFLRILLSKGIRSIIRKSRGDDISAACGQLKYSQFE